MDQQLNKMKKVFWILALAATVFVFSCTEENENEGDNLSQQILGKWMLTKIDGKEVPTNEKLVYTVESATKGYVSASRVDFSDSVLRWTNHQPCEIAIDGNKITITGELNKTTTFVAEMDIRSISSTEMSAESEYTVYHNGRPLYTSCGLALLEKVSKDYSADILGQWEGHVTNNEGSEFDDGELHRWEYLSDGTYIYYMLDSDSNWVQSDSEFSEYFVDGTLLCTRWKNVGDGEVENREWWEIASISNGTMNWTALRQKEDGTTYTATFHMTKTQ